VKSASRSWRVTPVAYVPIGLAIVAESVSNALRAYGLGLHLDRFTVTVYQHPVSIAGWVLVLAAVAVSLTQTRAAWVALTPSGPARQRIVAGFIAVLLLSISITAMASHILESNRAKTADEGGARARYDRAKAAYDKAAAELTALGDTRPVAVIQTAVQDTKIDMVAWRRSSQCSDITRDDTKEACRPILKLYQERGFAARKLELEPEVARLRAELATLSRPEEASASESTVSMWWAWIMGLGVVMIATFGPVIFASVVPVASVAAEVKAEPVAVPVPPQPRKRKPAEDRAAEVRTWVRSYTLEHGHPPSFSVVKGQFNLPKATASRLRASAL